MRAGHGTQVEFLIASWYMFGPHGTQDSSREALYPILGHNAREVTRRQVTDGHEEGSFEGSTV